MSASDYLELQLVEAYRLQSQHYETALTILNKQPENSELITWVNDLQCELQQIAMIEQRTAPERHAWENAARTPGAELSAVLKGVAVQIQSLLVAIDRRTEEISKRKQHLLPVLDEFIRHRHMLQSYEQYSRS
jgi:hypothetical protein